MVYQTHQNSSMIKLTDLKEKDKGREVEYTRYTRTKEEGILISWDTEFMYVAFKNSSDPEKGTPCKGINLNFI